MFSSKMKVKLPPCLSKYHSMKRILCLTKHYDMKTYCESGGIAPPRILNLGTRWRQLASSLSFPLHFLWLYLATIWDTTVISSSALERGYISNRSYNFIPSV